MTSEFSEIDYLRSENEALRSRLAAADAQMERDARARQDLEHLSVALTAGGVIGTWNWIPKRDCFTGDAGFAKAFGLDLALVNVEIPIGRVLEHVHPEDRPSLDAAIERAIVLGGAYSHQYRVMRSDGKYYWLLASGRVDYDEQGEPISFPGFVIDVTEQRTAEERLRISEALAQENVQRVQLALDAGAIIGTWNWDLQTDLFNVDQAFASAFGLDPALGRVGIPFAQIVATVHPDDQQGLASAIHDARTRGGAYAHQYRVKRNDGRYYWLEANGFVEHSPEGIPLRFPGVLIDVEGRRAIEAERDRAITELRALNDTLEQRVAERTAELIKAQERLRQSQKMEAVGQLTGGLAHDFNNLLAGISGALEIMLIRLRQERFSDIGRYIAVAQDASKRAAALTHRLLAFSRRQTLDPRPTNIGRLVDGMQDLIQRTVGPSITVEVISAPGLWVTLVDPSQLENALLNLCINARDAMPGGGRITIETANQFIEGQDSHLHQVSTGDYLSLRVVDTGVGMSPEVISRAFEPFFTTKPLGEGTGLGLSMIYGFAQQSGGQVRISSEEGHGTAVHIYLPRYDDETVVEADTPESPRLHLQELIKGGTVLVVDDEPSVRMLVSDILEDLGYVSIEAVDSIAGLKLLQSNLRIDLLITDVGLPGGLNGRQMADAARVFRSDLKVLFITGYAESSIIGSEQLPPGMSVLTKPFQVDSIVSHILSLIEGRPVN
ncbi:PAS domain-containing protein [Pseudomonas sp. 14P_5.3_Bac1]|uniref:PAS domain-containing protein n=1 Tax=Pseudomonas sp. 14P_5.3_Bac1 TaxID=2971622 RepID=UPI0021CAA0DD|nr:PAS domain-containing protein [Pseudomonas sp. 14P_5.3_Bac1]MCU1780985.1 PAS domain-containing protein [Pseudomonas sp. 14P_5.3_Bac1]